MEPSSTGSESAKRKLSETNPDTLVSPNVAKRKVPIDEREDVNDTPKSLESGTNWARPAVPKVDPEKAATVFQQIEIDEQSQNNTPQLQIFGITEAGHSVLAHIQDFLPHFWVPAPKGWQNAECQDLKSALNSTLSLGALPIINVTMANKESMWGYTGNIQSPFLKITVTDLVQLKRVKELFEKGDVNFREKFSACKTFESNLSYTKQFMLDKKVTGMNWLEVPVGTYHLRAPKEHVSKCQIELDASSDDLISHAPEGEWSKMAPFRVLSYDIECIVRGDIFPEPRIDPVIQIANLVTIHGSATPVIRNVFTLNTCSPIDGSQVLEFKSERDLLVKWQQFVEECDPDLMIGYNTSNFDMPYLLDRAKALNVASFPYLGRIRNSQAKIKATHTSITVRGIVRPRVNKETRLDGRLQLDLLKVIQRDHCLPSNTLNAASAHFLGEKKDDVHYSMITGLQNGTAESRRRLAVYCLKDAYLPQRLMDKLGCFIEYTERARKTGVQFNQL